MLTFFKLLWNLLHTKRNKIALKLSKALYPWRLWHHQWCQQVWQKWQTPYYQNLNWVVCNGHRYRNGMNVADRTPPGRKNSITGWWNTVKIKTNNCNVFEMRSHQDRLIRWKPVKPWPLTARGNLGYGLRRQTKTKGRIAIWNKQSQTSKRRFQFLYTLRHNNSLLRKRYER